MADIVMLNPSYVKLLIVLYIKHILHHHNKNITLLLPYLIRSLLHIKWLKFFEYRKDIRQ
jgi:hypothetical protein